MTSALNDDAAARRGNRLQATLAAGRRAFGTWVIDSRHAAVIRQIAEAGFDFVYLEMEHSSLGWETIGDFCEMTRAIGMTPIVRPAELTRESTLRLLEIGAMGVMFHDVDDRAEVDAYVDWIARSKSMLRPDKARQGAGGVSLVVQIETLAGLADVDAIVGGGGIDVVEIGRGDLATELGYPAQRHHPAVNDAIDRIVAACNRHGVAAAVTCFSEEDAADMARRGLRVLSWSADRYILQQAYRDGMRSLREVAAAAKDTKEEGS